MSDSKKRTLDAFFKPPPKKPRASETRVESEEGERHDVRDSTCPFSSIADQKKEREFTRHTTYPFPIPYFPVSIATELSSLPSTIGKEIKDQADLDLLYFEPYIPRYL